MAKEVVTRGGVFRFSEKIEGVVLFKPKVYPDERGLFLETYNEELFKSVGINVRFCQSNLSESAYGVVRGLHLQLPPFAQAKLVGVPMGSVYDVVVDVRPEAGLGIYDAYELSEKNHFQLLIPLGCLHAFQATDPVRTVFSYQVDGPYSREASRGVFYNDPKIAIPWPISHARVSDQDKAWPTLEVALPQFRNQQWQ